MKIASWDFLSKTLGRPNGSEEPAGKKPSVYVFANGHYSLVDISTSFGIKILLRFRHGGDVGRYGGIAMVSYGIVLQWRRGGHMLRYIQRRGRHLATVRCDIIQKPGIAPQARVSPSALSTGLLNRQHRQFDSVDMALRMI